MEKIYIRYNTPFEITFVNNVRYRETWHSSDRRSTRSVLIREAAPSKMYFCAIVRYASLATSINFFLRRRFRKKWDGTRSPVCVSRREQYRIIDAVFAARPNERNFQTIRFGESFIRHGWEGRWKCRVIKCNGNCIVLSETRESIECAYGCASRIVPSLCVLVHEPTTHPARSFEIVYVMCCFWSWCMSNWKKSGFSMFFGVIYRSRWLSLGVSNGMSHTGNEGNNVRVLCKLPAPSTYYLEW